MKLQLPTLCVCKLLPQYDEPAIGTDFSKSYNMGGWTRTYTLKWKGTLTQQDGSTLYNVGTYDAAASDGKDYWVSATCPAKTAHTQTVASL